LLARGFRALPSNQLLLRARGTQGKVDHAHTVLVETKPVKGALDFETSIGSNRSETSRYVREATREIPGAPTNHSAAALLYPDWDWSLPREHLSLHSCLLCFALRTVRVRMNRIIATYIPIRGWPLMRSAEPCRMLRRWAR